MLQEHSAIRSTFIKLPLVFKTFVLSIFEWLLKTGFTVPLQVQGWGGTPGPVSTISFFCHQLILQRGEGVHTSVPKKTHTQYTEWWLGSFVLFRGWVHTSIPEETYTQFTKRTTISLLAKCHYGWQVNGDPTLNGGWLALCFSRGWESILVFQSTQSWPPSAC